MMPYLWPDMLVNLGLKNSDGTFWDVEALRHVCCSFLCYRRATERQYISKDEEEDNWFNIYLTKKLHILDLPLEN